MWPCRKIAPDKRASHLLPRTFHLACAMIVVLARHRIANKQLAATNHAIDHMHNRNVIIATTPDRDFHFIFLKQQTLINQIFFKKRHQNLP